MLYFSRFENFRQLGMELVENWVYRSRVTNLHKMTHKYYSCFTFDNAYLRFEYKFSKTKHLSHRTATTSVNKQVKILIR